MNRILIAALVLAPSMLPPTPAAAWMRGGGGSWSRTAGGGYAHEGDAGGFNHATAVGPNGVAHEGDAGGYDHGTAANSQGAIHGSDYGGYDHSTATNGYSTEHTNAYGTTTSTGAYYHQPAVVNSYGSTCYNCGGSGWGAGAAVAAGVGGLAVGTAIGAAAASNAYAARPVYPIGATYASLPAGCGYNPVNGAPEYVCGGGVWLMPAYGANGVYYRIVPAP